MPLFSLSCRQLICICLFVSTVYLSEDKPTKEYERQREKLLHESSPVAKVKILIKMAEINLEEAGDSVRKGNLGEADKFLIRYSEVIHKADELLKSSHRNAQKNPAGFKDFEISLRKQLRKLADWRLSYPVDEQQKISEAITSAEAAKEDMFQAIFGPENIRRGKSDHPEKELNEASDR